MMGDYDDRRWMMDGSSGGGGWLVMTVLLVLVLGFLVALLVWLVRSSGSPDTRDVEPPRPSRARELLDQRFASGEIDEEDYRNRVRVLRGG